MRETNPIPGGRGTPTIPLFQHSSPMPILRNEANLAEEFQV